MQRAIFVLVMLFAVLALAQDTSQVTIKNGEVNNGVVIITAVQDKASFELQCNQGVGGCKVLQPGSYIMVRLPKGQGMYDCANVEVYPAGSDPASAQRIGAFCLIQK